MDYEPNMIIDSSGIEARDFTIICRAIFRDKRLSLKALGLLTTMLSRDDTMWNFSVEGEKELHADGRDSIKSALRELEKYGYLTREQSRDEKGRLGSTIWHVYDRPRDVVTDKETESDVDPRQITIDEVAEYVDIPKIPGCEKTEKAKKSDAKKTAAGKNLRTVEAVIKLFGEICPDLPQPRVPISDKRSKAVLARYKDANEDLEVFRELFTITAQSDFLSGRKTEWKANFDWLMKPANYSKVLEGNYSSANTKKGKTHNDTDYRSNDYKEYAGIQA